MMALATPMMVFYALAIVIGFLLQKAKRKKKPAAESGAAA